MRYIDLRKSSCAVFVLIILCLSCLFSHPLLADTVEIYGLDFTVDEVAKIDDRNTRVSVNGQARIVAPDDLYHLVVKAALSDGEFFSSQPIEEVEGFILNAIEADDPTVALEFFVPYLQSRTRGEVVPTDFLLMLPEASSTYALFRAVLHLDQRVLGHIDPAILSLLWLRASVGGSSSELPPLIRPTSIDEDMLIQSLILLIEREGKTSDVIHRYLNAARKSLRSNNTQLKEITVALQKLETLQKIEPKLEREVLYPYLSTNREGLEYQLIRPMVVEKIHEFSEFAMSHEAPLSALILISELLPHERSVKSQEAIAKALSALKAPIDGLQTNRNVRKLLVQESKNSPTVNAAYINYLKREFRAHVDNDKLRAAGRTREMLRGTRLQNQSDYDAMLFEEAIYWFQRDQQKTGNELLELRSRNPGMTEQFSLFWNGRYGSPLQLMMMGAIPVLIVMFLLMRRKHLQHLRAQQPDPSLEREFADQYSDPREQISSTSRSLFGKSKNSRTPFNSGSNRSRESPELREYRKLLRKLELTSDAGLQDIKRAYRSLIKKVHPDAMVSDQTEDNAELSEEFIALSRVYERVLELRQKLGLPE